MNRKYAVTRRWHRWLLGALDFVGAPWGWWRKRRARWHLLRPLEVRRLLLVRRRRFGDLILLLPAVERARELFPRATITWLAEPQYGEFLRTAATGAEIWCPASWREIWQRRRQFDLALEFHGEVQSIVMARLLARRVAGYAIRGGGFLLDLEADYDWHADAATRQVNLVEAAAGGPFSRQAHPPRLMPAPEWQRGAAPLLHDIRTPYVLLHPGCGQPAKRWPPERWRAPMAHCRELDLDVVLAGGPGDVALCEWLARSNSARNLAGRTDWGALAGLVAGAACVVAPDTGIAHLARALGVATVTLFGPTDPEVWGGRGENDANVVQRLPCSHCNRGHCRLPQARSAVAPPCMQAITVAEVSCALEMAIANRLPLRPPRILPGAPRRRDRRA